MRDLLVNGRRRLGSQGLVNRWRTSLLPDGGQKKRSFRIMEGRCKTPIRKVIRRTGRSRKSDGPIRQKKQQDGSHQRAKRKEKETQISDPLVSSPGGGKRVIDRNQIKRQGETTLRNGAMGITFSKVHAHHAQRGRIELNNLENEKNPAENSVRSTAGSSKG